MGSNNIENNFAEFNEDEIGESKVNDKFEMPTIFGTAAGNLPLPRRIGVVIDSKSKFAKLNKAAVPVAVVVDLIQTGVGLVKDCKNKTSRNTVENFITIAAGWGGGYGGAVGGAAIGTVVCPGIGTSVGVIIGGITGAVTSSLGSGAVTNLIADKLNYDVIERKCRNCGKKFKERIYRGERNVYICRKCRKQLQKSE